MFTKAEVGCGMSSDPLEDSSEGKGETTAWQDSEGFLTWSQRKPQNPTQVTQTAKSIKSSLLSHRQQRVQKVLYQYVRKMLGDCSVPWWPNDGEVRARPACEFFGLEDVRTRPGIVASVCICMLYMYVYVVIYRWAKPCQGSDEYASCPQQERSTKNAVRDNWFIVRFGRTMTRQVLACHANQWQVCEGPNRGTASWRHHHSSLQVQAGSVQPC